MEKGTSKHDQDRMPTDFKSVSDKLVTREKSAEVEVFTKGQNLNMSASEVSRRK